MVVLSTLLKSTPQNSENPPDWILEKSRPQQHAAKSKNVLASLADVNQTG